MANNREIQMAAGHITGPWLPELLKAFREKHGLGVREMARRLGVSPTTYSRIEKGSELSIGNVIDLLQMLTKGPALPANEEGA